MAPPQPRRSVSARLPGLLGWGSILLAVLMMVPLASVVRHVATPSETTWSHLASTVLPGYVGNTVALLAGVSYGVISIGVLSAWLVTAYRFPGRRVLEWALILPLAMPAYVMAYAYTDWLEFAGPVQTLLRDLTGWRVREYWFPDIRSIGGAIAVLSFALYPYVYLLARASFLDQSRNAIEAGRLLGYSAWGSYFFRVALPLARPGIVAGTALALMETLADFGTVSYFAVQRPPQGSTAPLAVDGRFRGCGAARHLPARLRDAGPAAGALVPRRSPLPQSGVAQTCPPRSDFEGLRHWRLHRLFCAALLRLPAAALDPDETRSGRGHDCRHRSPVGSRRQQLHARGRAAVLADRAGVLLWRTPAASPAMRWSRGRTARLPSATPSRVR